MKYKILITLLCIASVIESKEYKVKLILSGKQYDKVYLAVDALNHAENLMINSSRYDKQENSWLFTIPDSITEKLISYRFIFENKNESENTIYRTSFRSVNNGDTIKYPYFPLDYKIKTIRARYLSTQISKNAFIRYKKKNIIGTSQNDYFLMSFTKNTEQEIQSKYLYFQFYDPRRKVQLSYAEYLTININAVKEYPHSRYLLGELAASLSSYKSKGDLQNVFTNFSDELKQSYIGRKITEFIVKYPSKTEFKNIAFSWYGVDQPKPIIEDSTKFNLIVFSASWCGPCHKLIPDLKKMYDEKYKNLIITYVSIDKAATVKRWNELMHTENIPWRNLVVANNQLEEFYYVYAIPKMFFVYPGAKKMMEVDIRDKVDLEKMTGLLKK